MAKDKEKHHRSTSTSSKEHKERHRGDDEKDSSRNREKHRKERERNEEKPRHRHHREKHASSSKKRDSDAGQKIIDDNPSDEEELWVEKAADEVSFRAEALGRWRL